MAWVFFTCKNSKLRRRKMKLKRRDFIRSTAVAAAGSLGIFLSPVNVFVGKHHKY